MRTKTALINAATATNEANMTTLAQNWGAMKYVILPVSSNAYGTPIYGNGATSDDAIAAGDTVASVKSTGEYSYRTMPNPMAPASGESWCVKFIPVCAGTLAGKEDAVQVKQDTVTTLTAKKAAATSDQQKAALQDQINATNADIATIHTSQYALMLASVNLALTINTTSATIAGYQNDISTAEQTFASAMGDLLQDMIYEDESYAPGQEEALYNDSVALLETLCRPQNTYTLDEIDLANTEGYSDEVFDINTQSHFYNETLNINDYGFTSKVDEYLDRANTRKVDIQTDILNIQSKTFSSLLSRITDAAQIIKDKQSIYDRARAISLDGYFGTDKLEGYMDVLQNKLLSSASTWYTDDRGNMIFESADGNSAMMLSGSGFMVADGKTNNGWNWRTFGTGEGFTADLITAGILQAGLITILGSDQFYWTGDNLYVIDTNDDDKQIRIGRYDGTNLGIAYTTDGGTTWQNAIDFNGVHLSGNEIELVAKSVDIGGTNLFVGTQRFATSEWVQLSPYGWYSDGLYNGCVVKTKTGSWNGPYQYIDVVAGEYYTYSCWIRGYTSNVPIRSYFADSSVTGRAAIDPTSYRNSKVDSFTSGQINANGDTTMASIGNGWERVWFTVKVTRSGQATPLIQVGPSPSSGTDYTWSICGIKFERGNKATDWSAEPDELYAGASLAITEAGIAMTGANIDMSGGTIGMTAGSKIDMTGGQINMSADGSINMSGNGGILLESNGQCFTMDSSGAVMQKLSVDNLISPNIVRVYSNKTTVTIGTNGDYANLSSFANDFNNKNVTSNITVNI